MNLFRTATSRRRYGSSRNVMKARLLFARQLMVQYGVPYDCIWYYSGFSSVKDMERNWERMF
ncbi:MAG TPA: hypothetical protein IAC04_02035 [Candidatus Coprenecus stercoravium]|uniref:Uncharacterized protein n=1 Tax=Candidatus Coprenecus stercoravium TaxID=2840735 RepID=A0A9D2K9T4_9BACT|nr:hypothetical protein [Candidatus Coprenecus stercoravium]